MDLFYLSAEVGHGKTSIAQRLREEFTPDKSKKVVFAFTPNLRTAIQFIRFIVEEFEVKTARSYADALRNFENYLITQFKQGEPQFYWSMSHSTKLPPIFVHLTMSIQSGEFGEDEP